jgi:predicted enzyme related to lactoylglutathione lyase
MDQSNGASGALVKMKSGPSNGNSTVVYFMSEDCATEAGRVSSNGGKVTQDKLSIGQYGFAALITDTEGNLVGVHSMQ